MELITALPLPAKVGTEKLPVVASALIEPYKYPFGYIALVDRGGNDLNRRYATLRVWVWVDRVVAELGHYDMSWDEARQDFCERAQLSLTSGTLREPQASTPLTNRLAT